MEPYFNNGNNSNGADNNMNGAGRPDEGRSWQDAGYTPSVDSTEPPRYYVPPEKITKDNKESGGKKPGGFTFAKVACLCLACALIVGVAGGTVLGKILDGKDEGSIPAPMLTPQSTPRNPPASGVSSGKLSANDIYKLGCQQVVGIQTDIETTNFFGMISSVPVSGSGFILTEDGYIMTNCHVIKDAHDGGFDVKVILHDGTEYPSEIVGFDEDNDIAVLKIDAENLKPVSIGNSDAIQVGDAVFAIGNPLGELAYSMSDGMISATDRVVSTRESTNINMFQLTAAINEGNSGGPVYNGNGEVVGVVTAKYSRAGVEGLGFAIPINDAVSIASDLITNGYVTGKAYMGIVPMDISPSAVRYYNMVAGTYVYSVIKDSAAEKAGIKQGDIITKMDGADITSSGELHAALKSYRAGDTVDVVVWRSGEYKTLSITFDEEQPKESDAQDKKENTPEQNIPFFPGEDIHEFFPGFGYMG